VTEFHPSAVSFRSGTAADDESIAELHTASWRGAYRGILPDAFLDGEIAEERRGFWKARLS
jgi:hypothetical protein